MATAEAQKAAGPDPTQSNGGAPDAAVDAPVIPVSQAFSLGWNVCLLYLSNAVPSWEEWRDAPERLPAPSGFSEREQSLIRLGQVRSTIDRFNAQFATSGGDGSLLSRASGHLNALDGDQHGERPDPRRDLYHAHRALSQALSAGDPRLAKAYHLGVSLATISNAPRDERSLKQEFGRPNIAQLGEGLADLSSLFPDHASRAVRLSCGEWRRWVEKPEYGRSGPISIGSAREMVWGDDGDDIRASLARQGEVWRALLSGEKSGVAMLELHAYFATAVRALKHGARLVRGVLLPIAVALVLLLVGSFLLVKNPGAGATALGVVTVAGAVGITWKGILGGLGSVAARLQRPVWGAALDEEIAAAITLLPPDARPVPEEADEAAPASGPQPEALATDAEPQPEAA